ncbi:MAG: ATP-binding protein [Armatimonadota bacterium]|nr:ATP-binding protein [Armatimonadota bacterium]
MSDLKQITIVSGKGGTGKTTTVAAFAALSEDKVIADCDVDASNLYLLMHPNDTEQGEFVGAKIAVRDEDACMKSGMCEKHCRFEAITVDEVDELACEGCGMCVVVCPTNALRLQPVVVGHWFTGECKYGPMAHARLLPAAESSGRLVTLVRQKAENLAYEHDLPLILIDGPPGLGCTTTAALADADMAVVLTEPTLSGIHDMERQIQMVEHFGQRSAIIINKADLNSENAQRLRTWCAQKDLPILGEIPWDPTVTDALAQEMPLVEHNDGPAAQAMREAWERTADLIASL